MLLDAIAAGELHLTGLLMLGPHLTAENVVEVMARAKHRTKREIARLVRILDPLPPVPARIEPLGPAPARLVPAEPTWEQFVGAMNPVRELQPGERPRDWGLGDDESSPEWAEELHAPARVAAADSTEVEVAAPARVDARASDELSAPQRFKVQFTATEEYVRLVDEAKALLSHATPHASLEEVQLRAMRVFVEALRKRKYGGGASRAVPAGPASSSDIAKDSGAPARRGNDSPQSANESRTPQEPRQRGRHIPLSIRRAVAARDDYGCTYLDATGRRCSETSRLEFHHVVPFAVSPSHEVSNLTLRCAAHNALAAEEDFGAEFVEQRRNSARHDRFSAHGR